MRKLGAQEERRAMSFRVRLKATLHGNWQAFAVRARVAGHADYASPLVPRTRSHWRASANPHETRYYLFRI